MEPESIQVVLWKSIRLRSGKFDILLKVKIEELYRSHDRKVYWIK